MNAFIWRLSPGILLVAVGLGLAAAPAVKHAPPKPASDVQEFVFLGEARPVLIRLHVRVDGKTVHAAWDDFMKSVFAYLDVNGDGVLNKEEAERAPSVAQIRNGGIPPNSGGRKGRTATLPKMTDLDADKDGKVTPGELAAYYRKNGLVPFQVQLAAAQPNPFGQMALFGIGQSPSADAVSKAIFTLLDTNKDGKLSKEELVAAPTVLLKRDEDEDEIVTIRELVPNTKPSMAMFGKAMMGGPGKSGSTSKKKLLSITTPGQAPVGLVRSMQEHYGPRGKFSEKIKLGRKDLGLDEATFGQLDVNRDGVLDEKELEAFVKRAPDLELMVRLGTTGADQARMELVAPLEGPAPLAGKVRVTGEAALVDLGATRVDVRSSEDEDPYNTFGAIIRTQYAAQFSAADKDGKGYLAEKDLKGNPLFGAQFKAMDRDGDGKLTLKEVNAYLDAYRKIQLDATASSVTLLFADESRGLFDLLDVNGDRRLSVREMRGAVGFLGPFDRDRKGYLTRADIPRSYQLTLRRGAMDEGGAQLKAFALLYGGDRSKGERRLTAGPRWFRKMDRNRDGDVSRKEFLFSDELFRKIDADGDGLISVEEADRYDALLRKQK